MCDFDLFTGILSAAAGGLVIVLTIGLIQRHNNKKPKPMVTE